MNPLLSLNYDDLRRFQLDGKAFTRLVDAAVRASAVRGRISDSALKTNLRVYVKDGGVDTQVDAAASGDPSGRFDHPSIWQYKSARNEKHSSDKMLKGLRAEVNKAYAAKQIRAGHAYRYVIADNLTAQQKQLWEQTLTEAAHVLNPAAPPALVITADDLCAWVSEFPALVLEYKPLPAGNYETFDGWQKNVTADTPQYVSVGIWRSSELALAKHCDFDQTPNRGVFTLLGFAGVGKTRLVCEVLRGLPHTSSLVVYTRNSPDALRLVHHAVMQRRSTVIVVADECPLETRQELHEVLRDQQRRQRVRVIAIEAAEASNYHAKLAQMPSEALATILARNHAQVPEDRRNAYARLAKGYVRFAIDLCEEDPIAQGIPISEGFIADYLDTRLGDAQKHALFALATVARLGWKDDRAEELAALCEHLELDDPVALLSTLRSMKEPPGFVAEAGRYLYVTPEIVAHWAFGRAWKRWFERSPQSMLESMPAAILTSFLERVDRSAEQEVRRLVGETFRSWVRGLEPGILERASTAEQLITVVELTPERYAARLVELIEGAGAVEVDTWYRLVWFGERMTTRSAQFELAERLLRRLASHEVEDGRDEASAAWKRLFSITLSGTPVPFERRFAKLQELMTQASPGLRMMCIDAAAEALEIEKSRVRSAAQRSLVSEPEPEWNPADTLELRTNLASVIEFLAAELRADTTSANIVLRALVRNTSMLLEWGFIDELRGVLEPERLSGELLAELVSTIEFVDRNDQLEDAMHDGLRSWSMQLAGVDIEGRLLRYVGRWDLDHEGHDPVAILETLAGDLLGDPSTLEHHIRWLVSDVAVNPVPLGEQLGRQDSQAQCLAPILSATGESGRTGLARGYVFGLLQAAPSLTDRVSAELDRLEHDKPAIALDVALASGARLRVGTRAIRLVHSGRLPAQVLTAPGFWHRSGIIDEDQATSMLALLERARVDQPDLSDAAMKLLSTWLSEAGGSALLEREDFLALTWALVDARVDLDARGNRRWARVLGSLAEREPERAAKVAARGLSSPSSEVVRGSASTLKVLAKRAPRAVIRIVGQAMIEASGRFAWALDLNASVLAEFPEQILIEWVEEHGVAAARALAPHLPAPRLDEGEPELPAVTAFVLRHFEADEPTFEAFVANVHQLWRGSVGGIVAQHERRTMLARAFRDHPLRRIRQWAERSELTSLEAAQQWRDYEAEEQSVLA